MFQCPGRCPHPPEARPELRARLAFSIPNAASWHAENGQRLITIADLPIRHSAARILQPSRSPGLQVLRVIPRCGGLRPRCPDAVPGGGEADMRTGRPPSRARMPRVASRDAPRGEELAPASPPRSCRSAASHERSKLTPPPAGAGEEAMAALPPPRSAWNRDKICTS